MHIEVMMMDCLFISVNKHTECWSIFFTSWLPDSGKKKKKKWIVGVIYSSICSYTVGALWVPYVKLKYMLRSDLNSLHMKALRWKLKEKDYSREWDWQVMEL